MRVLPEALKAHLAGDEWTLATSWLFERKDGVRLGFTSHDRPLQFGGQTYDPGLGLLESATELSDGFAVGSQEVTGALSADTLDEAELAAGLWDGAAVTVYLVNWQAPEDQHAVLMKARIGEVTRDGLLFRAELRTLLDLFAEDKGRVYSERCAAQVGDAACTVNLDEVRYKRSVTVVEVTDGMEVLVSGAEDFEEGWAAGGALTKETVGGGVSFTVLRHEKQGSKDLLVLTRPVEAYLKQGESLTLKAGCDKTFETCQKKFQNTLNFRGFPHMPGNDFVLWGPKRDTGENTGGAL
ncbi:DUF2163 domain-containing protein [Pseudovibrio sp. SPO723]|uniref:DUF2163 domain-containing protein n=1 Tax=Nesiotobacter zosterae TaxID=392721 RepID=UPI0029C5F4F2|nr:DUF2163 domain-containing protein [Pseudovibrio sp. SPO723]MDX5595581.1 DUF2163 domain-containing protein [Pseudovibrio sp. SPO723]